MRCLGMDFRGTPFYKSDQVTGLRGERAAARDAEEAAAVGGPTTNERDSTERHDSSA